MAERIGLFDKEDLTDAGSYFWNDILAPRLADLIQDVIEDIFNAVKDASLDYISSQFGGNYARSYRSSSYRRGRTTYSYGSSSRKKPSKRGKIEEVLFESRVEAEDVVDEMSEMIEVDGFCSINDYYDIVGVKSQSHTDDDFGWISTKNFRIKKVDDSYVIMFPRIVRR